MVKVKIKPLSVNQTWAGRRFKTPKYKAYEQEMFYLLPSIKIPPGKLKLKIEYGFSNKLSDIDNPTKPFIDILQKKYNFNDKMIYKLDLEKKDVPKGEDYLIFEFSTV